MRTLYLIATGGTIEKVYSEQAGAVHNALPKVEQYLKRLRHPDTDIRVISLMNKDSLEMTDEDRAGLVAVLKKFLPDNNPIVITHGTDTMVETAVYVEKAFPSLPVPIVLTGAMTPLGFEGSDGLQNLAESFLAARLLNPGVHIVLHGQVFPASRVRKDKVRSTFVHIADKGEFE